MRQPEVFRRVSDGVALRLPDSEQRIDAARRLIPLEFVLSGGEAPGAYSLAEGKDRIWPLVVAEYAEVWEAAEPSPGRE